MTITYPAGAVDNVYLENGFEISESPFGVTRQYKNAVELDMAVCKAILEKPARLNSKEVKYLRLRADWRQEDTAARLHVDKQTVSLWERERQIPAAADLLLRLRFLDEAPKRQRPKLHLKDKWRQFDRLVAPVRNYDYICRWDHTWTIAYQAKGNDFVAQPHAISMFIEAAIAAGMASGFAPPEKNPTHGTVFVSSGRVRMHLEKIREGRNRYAVHTPTPYGHPVQGSLHAKAYAVQEQESKLDLTLDEFLIPMPRPASAIDQGAKIKPK